MLYLISPVLIALFAISITNAPTEGFKEQQMKYPRVKAAAGSREASIRSLFEKHGLSYPPGRIFLRAFKREMALELWACTNGSEFKLLKTYRICASSGTLGPKRRAGDGQVPEGFYHINRFNPVSNFHLSLGLNYPNQSDRILGNGNPGGDIFIHGNCVTIGCLPITDEWISELYLIAVEARNAGQHEIPVHIFPDRLTDEGMQRLKQASSGSAIAFWSNLREGYDYFEKTRRVPTVTVDRTGRYLFR